MGNTTVISQSEFLTSQWLIMKVGQQFQRAIHTMFQYHTHICTYTQPFYSHYAGQPVLAGT